MQTAILALALCHSDLKFKCYIFLYVLFYNNTEIKEDVSDLSHVIHNELVVRMNRHAHYQ